MRLTRKGFRAWLETKPPLEIVGHCKSESGCPLARYLQDQGYTGVAVSNPSYQHRRGAGWLPPWAQHFADRVDLQPGVTLVTAKQALKHLKG